MRTIINNSSDELIIKNSKFITLLIRIDKSTDIEKELENIKKIYPKATHYCYAYRMEEAQKSSDDGEPGGTAGMPILNVLEKEDILNVLAIVIRYFGGVKLGAGGLVRAYSKAVKEALKKTLLCEMIKSLKCRLTFSYSDEKTINYLLKDAYILDKKYLEDITYTFIIDKNSPIIEKLKPEIINEEYMKKTRID